MAAKKGDCKPGAVPRVGNPGDLKPSRGGGRRRAARPGSGLGSGLGRGLGRGKR